MLCLGVLCISYCFFIVLLYANFRSELVDKNIYVNKYFDRLFITNTYYDYGAVGSSDYNNINYYNLKPINGINIILKVDIRTIDTNNFIKLDTHDKF